MSNNRTINQETGEIINVPSRKNAALTVPNMGTISKIGAVAGKNPPGMNLKDHPEFADQNFLCVSAKFAPGEDGGEYVIATGFIFPDEVETPTVEDHAVTLITGSENICSRISIAQAENALPVAGKLRRSGRAWFWD